MKSMLKDIKAMSNGVMVGAIIVVAIALIALMGTGTNTTGGEGDAGDVYIGTLSGFLKDGAGTGINGANVRIYLTEQGKYPTVYDAYEAYSENEVAAPEEGIKGQVYTTAGASGAFSFSSIAAPAEGKKFSLFIIDTDSGVSSGNYGMALLDIMVVGEENNLGTEIVKMVSSSETDNVYDSVYVYQRGDMTVYDDQSAAMTSYTWDTAANATLADEEITFEFTLNNDDSAANDITFYVAAVDDYAGTADIEINEFVIGTESATFSEVADADSKTPEYKNRPTIAVGAGTATSYVVDGSYDLARVKSTNRDSLDVTLDFDVDLSAATTTDQARIVINAVSFNGHEESEVETQAFTFIIGETETGGYA